MDLVTVEEGCSLSESGESNLYSTSVFVVHPLGSRDRARKDSYGIMLYQSGAYTAILGAVVVDAIRYRFRDKDTIPNASCHFHMLLTKGCHGKRQVLLHLGSVLEAAIDTSGSLST